MLYPYKKTTSEELANIINGVLGKKRIYNNYFGLGLDDLDYLQVEDTLVLRKREEGFYRLYLISDDKDTLIQILKEQPDNTVFNIPSRKGHEIWDELAKMSGYEEFDTFEHLINRNFKRANIENKDYATIEDFDVIKEKILFYFNPITGHFPDDSGLKEKISNKEILVIREDGEVKAAICYSFVKGRCILDFWYSESKQGLKLFYSLFDICLDNNIKTLGHWVKSSNKIAKKIYLLLGDVSDGLIDKTYIKKSSIK